MFSPETIENFLSTGGLALLALIVFAESGLFIGFFLPGDSLLFVAGFLASDAAGNILPPLPVVAVVVFVAAVTGDQVGYWFGAKVGPALFDRPKSRLFDPDHVVKAHAFYERYGAKTIVLARFVPIVRTFAPIVAGVASMSYRTFFTYNLVGGALWGAGVTTLGFFLGQIPFVEDNIELGLIVIVGLSVMPMVIEYIRHRRRVVAETGP